MITSSLLSLVLFALSRHNSQTFPDKSVLVPDLVVSKVKNLQNYQSRENSDDNYWVKNLSKNLLPNCPEVKAGKITALYLSASWCMPCKNFTPELIRFRDKYSDKFQFIYVSSDADLDSQISYMRECKMNAPSIPFNNREKNAITKDRFGDGIPQLLVYSADGTLLTKNGRTLIENHDDFDKNSKKGTDSKSWSLILKDWKKLKVEKGADKKMMLQVKIMKIQTGK
jgi:thiol-disulfide isomerase/thioredoxin